MSMDYERRGTLNRKKFEYYRDEITIDFLEIIKICQEIGVKNFLSRKRASVQGGERKPALSKMLRAGE